MPQFWRLESPRSRLWQIRCLLRGQGVGGSLGLSFQGHRCQSGGPHFRDLVMSITLVGGWVSPYDGVCVLVVQSCATLCDPMDCSPPGSSVDGILQARILEWAAMPTFLPGDRTWSLLHLLHWQVGSLPLAPPRKPCISISSGKFQCCKTAITFAAT